jgi:hypothetical protein
MFYSIHVMDDKNSYRNKIYIYKGPFHCMCQSIITHTWAPSPPCVHRFLKHVRYIYCSFVHDNFDVFPSSWNLMGFQLILSQTIISLTKFIERNNNIFYIKWSLNYQIYLNNLPFFEEIILITYLFDKWMLIVFLTGLVKVRIVWLRTTILIFLDRRVNLFAICVLVHFDEFSLHSAYL